MGITIDFDTKVVQEPSNYTFTMGISQPIPDDGYLSIQFPEDFDFSSETDTISDKD